MAAPGHEQLLVVQDHDTRLDQITHRIAHHPIQLEIDELQTTSASQQEIIDEIEVRKHELDRQQKRLDDEVSIIEDKRSEIDAKLYDGTVTATKDLLALQDEAKMLLERQTAIEDDELEIMEQLEPIVAELDVASGALASTSDTIAAKQADLDIALDELRAEQANVETVRATDAAAVPGELLKAYEGLRADMGGVAVARLVGTNCDGCNLEMSAVAFDQIKKQPDDAVVHCGECGRILIR